MTKHEFINRISEKYKMTKKEAAIAVDAVFDEIRNVLVDGDKIQITGFGTFEVVTRAAREARNPQTGEKLMMPETLVPRLKISKTFKDSLSLNK